MHPALSQLAASSLFVNGNEASEVSVFAEVIGRSHMVWKKGISLTTDLRSLLSTCIFPNYRHMHTHRELSSPE